MKKFVAVCPAIVLAAGCAMGPTSYTTLSPKAQADAFTCAMQQVNQLGYTVSNASKDGGIITASRVASGLGTALLTGRKNHDQLVVTIFDSGSAGQTSFKVTAGSATQAAFGLGNMTKDEMKPPSPKGKADANTILQACAPGGTVVEAKGEPSPESD